MGTEAEVKVALAFAQGQKLAVLSTVSPANEPESALMGIAVTDEFEIIFDTVKSSRKYPNLRGNPRVALVIGCSSEKTLQYEGTAEELGAHQLARYLPVYFAAFPDGPERQSWQGITYFVVHPIWLRYCDYDQRPPWIREFRWPAETAAHL